MLQHNKTVLITGTSQGLGKVIQEELLNNGYRIASISKDSIEPINTDNLLAVSGDILKEFDRKYFIAKALIKFKKIDVLINNAGIVKLLPLLKYTEEDFNTIFGVNVKGAFLMTQELIPLMQMNKKGYILNIGSTRSITSAPNKSLYSMSKFALRSLTESINCEFNKTGIKSTIICPGAIAKNNESNLIDPKEIAETIKYLLLLPKERIVREIIIGGQL